MLISNVKLVNFNCHENATFSFASGLNVVVLPNGGGKTSLIEGISFAFYGPRVLEASAETYVREGSVGSSLVNLRGDLLGETFSLTRYLKPARVSFEWKDVKIKKSNELSVFWKHKLVPAHLFKATICCSQREATLISQAKPALRRKLISELLRFDVITEAINSLATPSIRGIASVSEEQITSLQDELKELESIDVSRESFHREQLYLLEQESREDLESLKKRQELSQKLSSLSFMLELLSRVSGVDSSRCPVCGSERYDRSMVQQRLSEVRQQVGEIRSQLAQLPMSPALTEEQRKRICRDFSVEDHKAALSLIERKKACEASLSSLLELQEQLRKGQTVSQARAILRDFLDSMSVPLLNSVSGLTSKLLTGSPFRTVSLTPSFELEVDGRPFNKLSVGQRDFIAVVFRIAVSYIASALYGIERFPLLLDSIGDSLDENYFSLLMTVLSSEVTKLFPQIILTSHHA